MRIQNYSPCSCAVRRRHWPLAMLTLALAPVFAHADDARKDEAAERIVVTATLTPHDSRHVPATLTVIGHEELLQRPSLDLLDALRGLPGISLQDRGVGGRRVLSLRGMESRHTLFLVDGRRVSASDDVFGHSDFQYDWVPLDAIERIEVVRGPLSSLYGSEALGGVVNIITRPAKGPWRANGSVVMGEQAGDGSDQAGRSERLSVLGRGNLLADRVAATVNLGQNRRAAVAEESTPWLSRLEDIDTRNWGVGFNIYPADGQRVDINLSEGDETRWRDTETSRKLRHRAYYDLTRQLSSLRYRVDGEAGSLEARAYRAELSQTNRNTHNVAVSDPQTLVDDVLDLRGSLGLGSAQLLTLGSEFRSEKLEHRAFRGGAGEVEHRALFVQDEISLGDALQATLGWRRDRHAIFGNQDSPRAYLVWLPNADWSLKAGFGEGFRAPSLKQISPDYRWVGPYTFIGNADLRPETSRNVEAGFEYSGIDRQFSATVFDNRLDDLIVTQCLSKCTLPLGATYRFINVDTARIRGLELSARQKLASVLSLAANYTLLSARDESRDRDLPERPRHALNLEASLEQGDWQYALRMEASSKQIAYEANTEHTLDRFALWHFGLRYQLNAQWRLQAGVDNLLDHDFKRDVSTFAYNERGRFVWFGIDFSL